MTDRQVWKRPEFIVAFGLFVFALLYCAFTLSLPVERMLGDSFGYDPGSRSIPLLATLILMAAALFEMVKAVRRSGGAPDADRRLAALVLANIACSVFLIAGFRPLGFLVATSLTLYALIALNLRAAGAVLPLGRAAAGAAAALVWVLVLYSLLRGVVRLSFVLARSHDMPTLREPVVQGSAATLVVAAMLFLGGRVLARSGERVGPPVLIQTVAGSTLGIYIVFRLFFLIQLPKGVVTW